MTGITSITVIVTIDMAVSTVYRFVHDTGWSFNVSMTHVMIILRVVADGVGMQEQNGLQS